MKQCTFPDCNRKVRARGLCVSHYRQYNKGQELKPLRDYTVYPAMPNGKKVCTHCERIKDEQEDFYRRAGGILPHSWCKDCSRANATYYYNKRTNK